jgi:hypothetical protein
MSADPCRACGTALQHCLEMRNGPSVSECGTYCCAPCADSPDLHETERAPGTRTTAELRPGDTVRAAHPVIRTVRENVPPRPDSRWHVLVFEDGTSCWSASGDLWELVPPPPTPAPEVQYGVRNASGEIFPVPSRKVAQQLVDIGPAPDLEVVSRTVSPWEVLR